jgi:pimeloyl-ACP methyl ester carboxylesterase
VPVVLIEGVKLYYREHRGQAQVQAPPLVLVHGAGGNLMHWPGELRRLPSQHVYAVDLPGHGDSGGSGRSDIGEYAEVVRGFAEKLDLPPFVLGGHSMGGAIAQEFALRYGGRLAGLLLVGTGAKLRVAPQILTGILDDPDATAALLAVWTHGEGTDPNLLRLYVRRLKEVPARVVHGDFLACDVYDRRAEVGHIDVPTLIITGDADRMTPVRHAEFLRDQIPGSQLVVVPGAGHMVMLEQPAQVASAVIAFLERVKQRL